jgi:hypothetical protein
MMLRFTGLAVIATAILLAAPSAHAAVTAYNFTFDGASENPVNGSPATGTGSAAYDDVAHTLTLIANVTGLQGTVTQAHFHGPTATSGLPDNNPVGETRQQAAAAVANVGIAVGNPSLLNFPTGGNSVTYNQVIDLTLASTYNNTFLMNNGGTTAGAEAAFVGLLASGRTYWNIHTGPAGTGFPGGEVRGFPFLVPEPATMGLALVGLVTLGLRRRRK